MDNFGFLSLLPPLIAIVMAIITKQVLISLFVGIFLGATIFVDWNPIVGLSATFSDYLFPSLGDSWNASVIILTMLCGAFSLLLEKGGGAHSFAHTLNKNIKTPKQGQLMAWLGGVAVFFSDSTNPVLVGPIFRPITDMVKVSREKLSYIVDSTSAPMPAMIPFTAWGAYIITIIARQYEAMNYDGNALVDFVQGVPYQFYTIGAVVFVMLIAISGVDYGPMRKAEQRAYYEGKPIRDGSRPMRMPAVAQIPENANPTIWGMVIPLIVLIVTIFSMFLWTGGFPERPLLSALGNASSMVSLNVGFFLACIVAGAMAIASKVFTPQEAINTFFAGMGQMMEALIILVLAWALGSVCKSVGTADYLVQITSSFLTPAIMLVGVFLTACVTAFATGTSWGTFAIFLPISIALADAIGMPMAPAIGVAISGGIFGDHCSPISDTTVLSSMGSSVDHIDHVTTQLPYAITVAAAASVGYLVSAVTGTAVTGLLMTLAGLLIVLLVMGRVKGKTIALEGQKPKV